MVCHQSIKRIDCILSEAEIAFFDALILRNVCECLPTRLTMASSLINESGKNPIPFLPQKNHSYMPETNCNLDTFLLPYDKSPSEIVLVKWLALGLMNESLKISQVYLLFTPILHTVKVSFFLQCSRMQLITFQNFHIQTCFSQLLWFFSLKFLI